MAEHDITLTVNGERESLTVASRTLLVHALRDELGYTGANVGCETGKCGACTVHVDGDAVKSCTVLAVQADGSDVTTVEGLGKGDGLHPVQAAFHDEHGLQCGYCTPGMVMAATELLDGVPPGDREEIRAGLKGNVCRCTGYHDVVDAVEAAAAEMGDAAGDRGGDTADRAVEDAPAGED